MIKFIGDVKDGVVNLYVTTKSRTSQEWCDDWRENLDTFRKEILVYEDTNTGQIIVVDNRQGTGQPVKTYPDLDTAKVAVMSMGE